ncbi:MAG: hypothetical protein M1830_007562, partial [Pleopsidium flavum]
LGWDKTKSWTLWAVVAYFILNSGLTYWIWAVEKGKVFVGEKNGGQLTLSSFVTKHTPIYNLTVRYLNPSARNSNTTSEQWQTVELSAPFTKWFSADGYFVAKPFQQWLASEIPVVGQADPANVVKGAGEVKTVELEDIKGVLDGLKTVPSVKESGSPATRSRKSKR